MKKHRPTPTRPCVTTGCGGVAQAAKAVTFRSPAGKAASITPWRCLTCAEEWVDDEDVTQLCAELGIPVPPTLRQN